MEDKGKVSGRFTCSSLFIVSHLETSVAECRRQGKVSGRFTCSSLFIVSHLETSVAECRRQGKVSGRFTCSSLFIVSPGDQYYLVWKTRVRSQVGSSVLLSSLCHTWKPVLEGNCHHDGDRHQTSEAAVSLLQ